MTYANRSDRFTIGSKVACVAKEVRIRLFGGGPAVLDPAGTIAEILEERSSLSRFGDGEFNLIFGGSLDFQGEHDGLSERLASILKGEGVPGNCMIAIPSALRSLSGLTLKSKKFWFLYCAKHREAIECLLDGRRYLDSQATRFYINRRDIRVSEKLINLWKDVWKDRSVLVVEGEQSRFGVGNDLFENAKGVARIICPAVDAYASYDVIYSEILKVYADYDLVLLVLGPTATVLACDLARCGAWAVDIGNMDMEYEWYLRKAKNKIKIEGKYSFEVIGGTEVSELEDEEYESQILMRIES